MLVVVLEPNDATTAGTCVFCASARFFSGAGGKQEEEDGGEAVGGGACLRGRGKGGAPKDHVIAGFAGELIAARLAVVDKAAATV